MKIFLQHISTGLLFAGTGQWTKSPADALDFPNYDKATEYALEHKLPKVQVILKFADNPYNIRFPLKRKFVRPTSHPA